MDISRLIILLIVIIGAAAVLYANIFPYIQNKNKAKDRAKRDEIIGEDTIYEPTTGKHYTLEELEAGEVIVAETDKERIYTDEEIELLYRDSEVPVQLVDNYLRRLELPSIDITESYEQSLEKLHVLKDYTFWEIQEANQLTSKSAIMIIDLGQIYRNVHQESDAHSDLSGSPSIQRTILVLVYVSKNLSGHHFLHPRTGVISIVNDLSGVNDQLNFKAFDAETFRESSDIHLTRKELIPFMSLKEVEIEIFDNELYVISQKSPTVEVLEELLSFAYSLEERNS